MAKLRKGKAHGEAIEMEKTSLIPPKGEDDDTDFDHTPAAGPSSARSNLECLRGHQDGGFTEQPRQSTDSIEMFRFLVLGHNENLMCEACKIILGLGQSGDTNVGTCEFKDGKINGQPVSVVKTPSTWLKSFSISSFRQRLKSIKDEIEFCQSLVFPGPHAFLLVIEDLKTGKEKKLLQALSEVFGIKALDFCMVLFRRQFDQNDIQKNDCVKKCKYRSLILNSNQSVEELFQKTKEMIKPKKFFTNHLDCFEKAKLYFEKELGEIKKTDIEEIKRRNEEEIRTFKILEEAHQKKLEAQFNEKLLIEKYNALQLKSELDGTKESVKQLKNENEMLRREIRQLKSKAQETFPCANVQSKSALMQIQEQLQAIKEQLSERETRERESALRCIQSSGDVLYEHHSSTAVTSSGAFVYKVEREEETEGDSGASGSQKAPKGSFHGSKRRNSNDMGKPNMSGSEHAPLQSL